MKKILIFFINLLIINNIAIAQKRDYLVTLKTDFGLMHIVLFDETPKHKENFVKLAKKKFFNGLLFHRTIQDFMIQGGDPTSRNAPTDKKLGSGGDSLARIPFEFKPNRIHKKGALAAARDGNPEKASSACQFYIVQGAKISEDEIEYLQVSNRMNYTLEQKAIYKTVGGVPRLDNGYTVFGQVIDNQQVIDSVAKQPHNKFDRPLKDINMEISVKKMRKKKITRKFGYVF
jgi:cyclophilin family peptidyl-prolyl cis-trans isomerase